MQKSSRSSITNLLHKFPVNNKERRELAPYAEKEKNAVNNGNDFGSAPEMTCKIGRLSEGIPQIPPPPNTAHDLARFRCSLPIWKLRNEIVSLIDNNNVILVSGDTGCGKTTQVPQFILDHCHSTQKHCRIIVAEPRRLAALSVAQRVSQERGEPVGFTIGYQIRLESK